MKLSLELDHCHSSRAIASPLYEQLSSGRYDKCAVLSIPASVDEWRAQRRTARKRADKAQRLGYGAAELRRELHADDIHEINVSKQQRQGREMSAGYRERREFSPLPRYACPRHAIRTSGVFEQIEERSVLRAYLVMHRAGDLALVSQILGHGAHEPAGIMYLLFQFALSREINRGSGVIVYNRYDSGDDGLRFLKDRLGFVEEKIAWAS